MDLTLYGTYTLLKVDPSMSDEAHKMIFLTVQNYIKLTNRFH